MIFSESVTDCKGGRTLLSDLELQSEASPVDARQSFVAPPPDTLSFFLFIFSELFRCCFLEDVGLESILVSDAIDDDRVGEDDSDIESLNVRSGGVWTTDKRRHTARYY